MAHLDGTIAASYHFTQNSFTAMPGDGGDNGAYYSKAGSLMPVVMPNQFMVTLDYQDAYAANLNYRHVTYSTLPGNPAFFSGPLPCTGLWNGFGYRLGLTGSFNTNGTTYTCTSNSWYPSTNTAFGAAQLALVIVFL